MSNKVVFRFEPTHFTIKLRTKRPSAEKCLFITVHAGTKSGYAAYKNGNSARHFLLSTSFILF